MKQTTFTLMLFVALYVTLLIHSVAEYDLRSWNVLDMGFRLDKMIAGYDSQQDKIWLLGGNNGTTQLHTAYYMNPTTLTLTNSHYIPENVYSAARTYSTYGRFIYFISWHTIEYVSTFNMDTGAVTIQFATRDWGCYNSCTAMCKNSNILYVIAGGSSMCNAYTKTLNVDTKEWTTFSAELNAPRGSQLCECVNEVLWTFGGWVQSQSTGTESPTDTIEYYDISASNAWIQITDTLSESNNRYSFRSVVIDSDILSIAGWHTTKVDIIDTVTKAVTPGTPIHYARYTGAALYVPSVNRIFLCGGTAGGIAAGDGVAESKWEVSNVLDPTMQPTSMPTNPTLGPTNPTLMPSVYPTRTPSTYPTVHPSKIPTNLPTEIPSVIPTIYPTLGPSDTPTIHPTINPILNPSTNPTTIPSVTPTLNPTSNPSVNPTSNPTLNPSASPTFNPSANPTVNPSANPTWNPSFSPLVLPTSNPVSNLIVSTLMSTSNIMVQSTSSAKTINIIGIVASVLIIVFLY